MSLRNYVVLGPDSMGKTPLVSLIAEVTGGEIIKLVEDPRNMPREAILTSAIQEAHMWAAAKRLADKTLMEDAVRVYDRFPFPDDYVYQDLVGGVPDDECMDLFDNLSKLVGVAGNVYFIVLMPMDFEKYLEAFDPELGGKNAKGTTKDMMTDVLFRYNDILELFESRGIPYVRFDVEAGHLFTSGDASHLVDLFH